MERGEGDVQSRHPTGISMTLLMALSFGNGSFEFLVSSSKLTTRSLAQEKARSCSK